jgi:hypothetical protein
MDDPLQRLCGNQIINCYLLELHAVSSSTATCGIAIMTAGSNICAPLFVHLFSNNQLVVVFNSKYDILANYFSVLFILKDRTVEGINSVK